MFTYRKDAPSAKEAYHLFARHFHYLPESTSEPEILARMIQRLIFSQRSIRITPPNCPRHELRMVKLGYYGRTFVKPKQRGTMGTVHVLGKHGSVIVAKGLFRCPFPGCFLVAPLEESATITRGGLQ